MMTPCPWLLERARASRRKNPPDVLPEVLLQVGGNPPDFPSQHLACRLTRWPVRLTKCMMKHGAGHCVAEQVRVQRQPGPWFGVLS